MHCTPAEVCISPLPAITPAFFFKSPPIVALGAGSRGNHGSGKPDFPWDLPISRENHPDFPRTTNFPSPAIHGTSSGKQIFPWGLPLSRKNHPALPRTAGHPAGSELSRGNARCPAGETSHVPRQLWESRLVSTGERTAPRETGSPYQIMSKAHLFPRCSPPLYIFSTRLATGVEQPSYLAPCHPVLPAPISLDYALASRYG